MNELQIFENHEFGKIRVTTGEDGEPLFVAADVCRALEHTNVTMALERLDDDEKAKLNLGLSGGDTNCVTEAGLYTLVLGSRKPEAKAFKRWVTHEVIPAIRKHGGYLTPAAIEKVLLTPDFIIELATRLKAAEARADRMRDNAASLALLLEAEQYKIDYFDRLVETGTLSSLRETAKLLQVPEKKFIRWLIRDRFLFRDKGGTLLPYAGRDTKDGLFAVREVHDADHDWHGVQTFVTPKGRVTFYLLIESGKMGDLKMKLKDFLN